MSIRKTLLFSALGAALITAATTAAPIEDTLAREFTVDPGGLLTLEADEGGIDVQSWDRNTVRVEIGRKVRTGSKAEAEERLRDWTFEMQQKGNSVFVSVERRKENDRDSVDLHFKVTVPKQYSLDLETGGGNVRVANLAGNVDVETAGGSVELGKITGSVEASTAGGPIELGSCTGPARLETAGGDIDVEESRGNLVAETSGGNIHVVSSKGAVTARTAGGNIELDHARSGFDLETAAGNIRITLEAQPGIDSRMSTAAGNISLEMAGSVNLDLDAETSAGQIRSDFPVDIKGDYLEFRARGRINKGGPGLEIRTAAGNIELDRI